MIQREGMVLSPYIALYDIIIPKDHELRQLNELVDFSFVDDMLRDTYTLDNGRPGYRPQVMFKYLMLKRMYELSDRDVVSRAMTDMAFKYFLGIAPEADVIDPSSLTKFRKQRMKDDTIMDTLIARSVAIARENGIKTICKNPPSRHVKSWIYLRCILFIGQIKYAQGLPHT